MKCITLTGISKGTIEELKRGMPRTVELTSAHNIISLSHASVDTDIFLTSIDCEDIATGDSGIIVHLISVTISMKHLVEGGGSHICERERVTARMKVKFISTAKIRTAPACCTLTQATVTDIIKPSGYIAG
ncbi:MAG: DUF473 domain-containing protein [Methanomicrobiales archaeon]|jgi:hypothetical protein|nr:DUF473 domain-containing protein [Methanomicrobiales archaeon]